MESSTQVIELLTRTNELLQVTNTCLVVLLFLVIIYWLCKMYIMFFKATIL